jgi:hypothetical protein
MFLDSNIMLMDCTQYLLSRPERCNCEKVVTIHRVVFPCLGLPTCVFTVDAKAQPIELPKPIIRWRLNLTNCFTTTPFILSFLRYRLLAPPLHPTYLPSYRLFERLREVWSYWRPRRRRNYRATQRQFAPLPTRPATANLLSPCIFLPSTVQPMLCALTTRNCHRVTSAGIRTVSPRPL